MPIEELQPIDEPDIKADMYRKGYKAGYESGRRKNIESPEKYMDIEIANVVAQLTRIANVLESWARNSHWTT